MKTETILKYEAKNKDNIFLFQEGCFIRAYNRSAMRFVTLIKPIKILKKHIKKFDKDLYYCGFPKSYLEDVKIILNNKFLQIQKLDEFWTIRVDTHDEDYESWKQRFSTQIKTSKKPSDKKDFIINKIRNYPIDKRSPLETTNFVYELKELLEFFE